jgi:ankyrin repeat protein
MEYTWWPAGAPRASRPWPIPLSPTVDAQVRLVVAANKGDLFALRQQLARGAKVNERTPTGETPLVEAILRHSTSRSQEALTAVAVSGNIA